MKLKRKSNRKSNRKFGRRCKRQKGRCFFIAPLFNAIQNERIKMEKRQREIK